MAPSSDPTARDWWKTTAVFLSGVTLTGVTSWFAFWSNVPAKKEVLEMIQTKTPYVMDRAVLRHGVEENTRTLEVIRERLREVEKKQVELSAEFRNRIDGLIRHLKDRPQK